MFASLHQQLHNFKPESMKLLREVENTVKRSIQFCHNTLGPLRPGYQRGRRSGIYTVNWLWRVCVSDVLFFIAVSVCVILRGEMSYLQKNASQNWCISVLVLFCSSSLLLETTLIMSCSVMILLIKKYKIYYFLHTDWHCRERKWTAEWKLHTAMK